MIIVHKPRTMNKILKKREEIEEEDSKKNLRNIKKWGRERGW